MSELKIFLLNKFQRKIHQAWFKCNPMDQKRVFHSLEMNEIEEMSQLSVISSNDEEFSHRKRLFVETTNATISALSIEIIRMNYLH